MNFKCDGYDEYGEAVRSHLNDKIYQDFIVSQY